MTIFLWHQEFSEINWVNFEYILSKFWGSPDLPLIDCETELELKWIRNCIISEISITAAVAGKKFMEEITNAASQINSTKLYVSVVTLSINDNMEFSEDLRQELMVQELVWLIQCLRI